MSCPVRMSFLMLFRKPLILEPETPPPADGQVE